MNGAIQLLMRYVMCQVYSHNVEDYRAMGACVGDAMLVVLALLCLAIYVILDIGFGRPNL